VIFGSNHKDRSDEELMQQMMQGNSQAFALLYDRYSEKLIRYFYRMLGQDRDKAEDFTQDLFTKLIEKPQLFDTTKKFGTWVFSIACNMCKNEYRRLAVRQGTVNDEAKAIKAKDENSENVVDYMDKKSFNQLLHVELGLLDEKHRSVFILRFQEEMSIKEIGEALGISEGTVKSRLFYTLKKLSEKLKVFDLN
jgi:RNA polymerase sigma-70 factor (ECF subfamily)